MDKYRNFHPEAGSSRILAFISAILFMMLAWVVTHDYDPNAADKRNLSEYIKVASSEITQYALSLQTSVMRMKSIKINDISELSFENPEVEGYRNSRCYSLDCQLFQPAGGGAHYRVPDTQWLDENFIGAPGYGEWIFPSNVCVKDLPTLSLQPCHIDLENNEELMMLLPYVHENICEGININLGLHKKKDPLPVNQECAWSAHDKFTGIFRDGYRIADKNDILSNQIYGCVNIPSNACTGQPAHNVFFFVLEAR